MHLNIKQLSVWRFKRYLEAFGVLNATEKRLTLETRSSCKDDFALRCAQALYVEASITPVRNKGTSSGGAQESFG